MRAWMAAARGSRVTPAFPPALICRVCCCHSRRLVFEFGTLQGWVLSISRGRCVWDERDEAQRALPREGKVAGPRRRSDRRSHGRMSALTPDAPRIQLALQVMNLQQEIVDGVVQQLQSGRLRLDRSCRDAKFGVARISPSFLSYQQPPRERNVSQLQPLHISFPTRV